MSARGATGGQVASALIGTLAAGAFAGVAMLGERHTAPEHIRRVKAIADQGSGAPSRPDVAAAEAGLAQHRPPR